MIVDRYHIFKIHSSADGHLSYSSLCLDALPFIAFLGYFTAQEGCLAPAIKSTFQAVGNRKWQRKKSKWYMPALY